MNSRISNYNRRASVVLRIWGSCFIFGMKGLYCVKLLTIIYDPFYSVPAILRVFLPDREDLVSSVEELVAKFDPDSQYWKVS